MSPSLLRVLFGISFLVVALAKDVISLLRCAHFLNRWHTLSVMSVGNVLRSCLESLIRPFVETKISKTRCLCWVRTIRHHRYGGRIKLSRYGFGQAARTVDCGFEGQIGSWCLSDAALRPRGEGGIPPRIPNNDRRPLGTAPTAAFSAIGTFAQRTPPHALSQRNRLCDECHCENSSTA